MKTYTEIGSAAVRFDMSAKLAKVAMRSTGARSQAISNLHEAGAEIVAVNARGKQLAPPIRCEFDQLTNLLNTHIGEGPEAASDRRTILKRLSKFVKDPIFDVEQCTLALNKPMPFHLKPLAQTQPRVGPTKKFELTDETVMEMGFKLASYYHSLTTGAEKKGSVFNEANRIRDDIGKAGSKLKFSDIMLEDVKAKWPELHAVAMVYNQSLQPDLPRLLHGVQPLATLSSVEFERLNASSPEIPSTNTSPARDSSDSIARIKRRYSNDSTDAEELRPAKRMRINLSREARFTGDAGFEIYVDAPESPTRSPETIGSSPPDFEDLSGRHTPLRSIDHEQSWSPPPDANRDDRLRARRRDSGAGL